MTGRVSPLKLTLKRGALLAAANWPVAVIQFVADSIFKGLLAVPIIGGIFLVVLVVGGEPSEMIGSMELRTIVPVMATALMANPVVLASFLLALALVVLGGSAFMFFVKGGSVAVLVAADAAAEDIELAPLHLSALQRAGRFTLDGFIGESSRLFRRFLRLGLILIGVYAASGAAYLFLTFGIDRHGMPQWLGWRPAALTSTLLVVWITVVNLVYLLTQVVIAAENRSVRSAFGQVVRLVRAELRAVASVFGVMLGLVVLATAASVLATTALGLILFVPVVGVILILPVQLVAWIVRGLVFQYLGLTAIGAYLKLYRSARGGRGVDAALPAMSGRPS